MMPTPRVVDPADLRDRFIPAAITVDEGQDLNDMRALFLELAQHVVVSVEAGRYQSLALTALEEAAVWTTKAMCEGLPRE